MNRSLAFHAAILGVAALLALALWTRGETPSLGKGDSVRLWEASPERLTEILFEGEYRKMKLVKRKDDQGVYFEVLHESRDPLPEGHPTLGDADAAKVKRDKNKVTRFISVKGTEELIKDVTPLVGSRRIGRIDPKRNEEFGMHRTEGKLTFKFGSVQHSLTVGALAPGDSEIYVRDDKTNELYAISRDVVNRIRYADSRLMESSLHAFNEAEDASSVKLSKGDRKRELVPVEGKIDGWADISEPGKLDETAGNWMANVRRLKPAQYVEKPARPLGPAELIVRVDYFKGNKTLGFLELYNLGAEEDEERRYLGRTEHTRWYFTVLKSSVEQIERDVSSVLK